jgi:hypothetical protein
MGGHALQQHMTLSCVRPPPYTMDDSNQLEVPPSFTELFTAKGGYRLTRPMDEVRSRFELCEDLAQLLTEQASTTRFKTEAPPAQVLETIQLGLSGEDSPVQPEEAAWVVKRLAELLEWNTGSTD